MAVVHSARERERVAIAECGSEYGVGVMKNVQL
jgi:hypothetical protein